MTTEQPIIVTDKNAAAVAEMLRRFSEPFEESEIKLKPQKVKDNRALAIAYIDARLVIERLDEVAGMNNWKDEYLPLPGGSVECRLSVRVMGEWITKADVGSESEQPDSGDRMKAAYSDALKRAAVKFGIGRFLYRRPQVWMDYDPVKKQILRPEPRSQQAARTSAPQQTKDHPKLVHYRTKAATAVSRESLTLAWKEYEADSAAGHVPADVKPLIVAAFKAAGEKFQEPKV